jgi:hypothetical protein
MSDESNFLISSDDYALTLLDARLQRYEWEISRIVNMLDSDKLTDTQKVSVARRMASEITRKA